MLAIIVAALVLLCVIFYIYRKCKGKKGLSIVAYCQLFATIGIFIYTFTVTKTYHFIAVLINVHPYFVNDTSVLSVGKSKHSGQDHQQDTEMQAMHEGIKTLVIFTNY